MTVRNLEYSAIEEIAVVARHAERANHQSFAIYQSSYFINAWILANLLAAVALLLPEISNNPAEAITWGLFLLGNCVLLKTALNDEKEITALTLIAALFGALWVCPVYYAAEISDTRLAEALTISVLVVMSALPVLAPRGTPYYALLGTFTLPLAVLSSVSHQFTLTTSIGLGGILLAALITARISRHLAAQVSEILERGVRVPRKMRAIAPATNEETDYLDNVRTQLGAMQHALSNHATYTAILEALDSGIVVVDNGGTIEFMNPAAEQMTGYSLREARGLSTPQVMHLHAPGAQDLALFMLAASVECNATQHSEPGTTLTHRNGSVIPITFSMAPQRCGNERRGTVISLHSGSYKNTRTAPDTRTPARDVLTALCDRTTFEAHLHDSLCANHVGVPSVHALCVLNLDGFSAINAAYGSAAGDYVLRAVTDGLRGKLRGTDLLARLDDDRFGILFYHCELTRALQMTETLRELIGNLNCAWQTHSLRTQASVGLVELYPGQTSLTDALMKVDAACQAAKRAGGNQVRTLIHDDNSSAMHALTPTLARVKDIQIALSYDNFELYFQSALTLADSAGQPYGELQLRLCTSTGKILSERDFIPTAERYHLRSAIDRWLVKAAIDALRVRHPLLHEAGVVGIKISTQSVVDEEFLQYLVALLERMNHSRERLCFEIAEAHLVRHWERAAVFIATLRELGCKVALDSFGIGTHSFQILKRMQVDFLKIHRDVVRNVAHNSLDYEVLLSITRVAKSLRIQTIADGVRNLATRDLVRSLGIDFAHEFLVAQARPLTVRPQALH